MSDVVARVLDALNAHDVEAFVACYAADATIEDGDDNVFVRGHAQLREQYATLFAEFPDVRVEPLSRIDIGPYVVQEERVTGRSPEPARHVAVYRIAGGVIARERLLR